MKIIDEKGRLFGTVNVIDFFVSVITILSLLIVYSGYKALTHKDTVPGQWMEVRVKFPEVDFDFAKVAKSGDEEKDSSGRTIGRFLSVVDVRPSLAIINGKNDPSKKDAVADLEILCTEKMSKLYYKNSVVKIGNQITFSPKFYNMVGTIIDMKPDKKASL